MVETHFKSMRVLVVDDQGTMRTIIRRLLRQGGITNVEEASDGEAALEILRRPRDNEFDLIISDLHMEGLDGIGLCNAIRRDKEVRNRHIPILILTGIEDELLHEVARQVGAMRILTKPVSVAELFEGISAVIGYSASAT